MKLSKIWIGKVFVLTLRRIMKLLKFIISISLLLLVSCNKNEAPANDILTGTTWYGIVKYTFPTDSGIGGGAITGPLTLEFQEGGQCYQGYWGELVPYTLSKYKTTVTIKNAKINAVCTIEIKGNIMTLTGSDNECTYSGTLTRE